MLEIHLFLFEALLMLGVIIFIFIYSAFSVDMLTTLIAFLIFLILLIPFYLILDKLKVLLYVNNLENITLFKLIFFYSTLINVFIGIYFSIQSIYLIAFS